MNTTDEWIEFYEDEAQEFSDGKWEAHTFRNSKFRIKNPYYLKPQPSTFERCIVGQTVLSTAEGEFLVTGRNGSQINIGGVWVNVVEVNKNMDIIRGGA